MRASLNDHYVVVSGNGNLKLLATTSDGHHSPASAFSDGLQMQTRIDSFIHPMGVIITNRVVTKKMTRVPESRIRKSRAYLLALTLL